MGLGSDHMLFYHQIPQLSKHHQTIAIDNRGAGRTDKPDTPYSIKQMADDTAGLMETIGIAKAHVFGVSMGGFIAQELALQYPAKVNKLILGCTACSSESIQPSEGIVEMAAPDSSMPPAMVLEKTLPVLFSDQYITESKKDIYQFITVSMKYQQPRHAFIRQLEACMSHDTCSALSNIKAPTLVITGDNDPLIPADNSRILADRLNGARLDIIPETRHCFFIEKSDMVNKTILDFLNEI